MSRRTTPNFLATFSDVIPWATDAFVFGSMKILGLILPCQPICAEDMLSTPAATPTS